MRVPCVFIPMALMPAKFAIELSSVFALMPRPDARGYILSLHLPYFVSTGCNMVKRSYLGTYDKLFMARNEALRMAATSSAALPVPCPSNPCKQKHILSVGYHCVSCSQHPYTFRHHMSLLQHSPEHAVHGMQQTLQDRQHPVVNMGDSV